MINALFPLYLAHPDLLPADWQGNVAAAGDETALARVVLDYVAGMTDRFAIKEFGRLVGQGKSGMHLNQTLQRYSFVLSLFPRPISSETASTRREKPRVPPCVIA